MNPRIKPEQNAYGGFYDKLAESVVLLHFGSTSRIYCGGPCSTMHLKLTGFLYYISMLFTAISWSAAIDWRTDVETGIVIQKEFIWWAVLSLMVTVGLYLYQRRLIKQQRDRHE